MKTCIDKVCEGVLCDDECKDLKPSICGKNRELFAPENACSSIRIEGADDVEINQGVCIDLTEGVHAYDGNGREIEYEVEPSEIGCCDVGEHEVTYTAIGSSKEMIPYIRTSKPMLGFNACGLVVKKVKRLVTILQALPPTIIGAVRTVLPIGASFDPMYGVSGIDDNGNATEVTFEGRYDVATDEADIVTFDSDVVQDLRSVKVSLEPIQDLNGYDKPWAGGAGKNLLNITKDSEEKNGVIATRNEDGSYTLNGTCTENGDLQLVANLTLLELTSGQQYTLSGCPLGGSTTTYRLRARINTNGTNSYPSDTGDGATFTAGENAFLNRVYIEVKAGYVYNNLNFYPMVEKGGTKTSYEPYTNICPISGHESVSVTRVGKNFLPIYETAVTRYGVTIDADSSRIKVSGTPTLNVAHPISGSNADNNKLYMPMGEYIISGMENVGGNNSYVGVNINSTSGGYTATSKGTTNFIVNDGDFVYPRLRCASGDTFNNDVVYPMIRFASEADATYEPFNGNTYTTELGQTVYGGYLDVVSGELTITDGYIESYNGETLPSTWISDRDVYASGVTPTAGAEVVYKLATPTTIQLTPQQIALALGINNVWSEDGKVQVVYSTPLEDGLSQFDYEGVYPITYHTEDSCGNETDVTRYIVVGDNLIPDDTYGIACQGKACYSIIECEDIETFRTVIYEDGTLIINESSNDKEANIAEHGQAEHTYEPLNSEGTNYVWTSEPSTLWHESLQVMYSINRVEIGSHIRPTSIAYWFYLLRHCTEMDLTNLDTSRCTHMRYAFAYIGYNVSSGEAVPYLDLSMFDTSKVVDMDYMFNHLYGAKVIDISSWDTSAVEDMYYLFSYCNLTETIYASDKFVTPYSTPSYGFFLDCFELVGGKGTSRSSIGGSQAHYSTYARLDNPPNEPGYFTEKQ